MNTLCFIDLDGVLVDFVEGAFKHYGINIPYPEITWDFPNQAGIPMADFFKPFGKDFWSRLCPTWEFDEIIPAAENKFGKENVFLCSHPCETDGCITGKAAWIERWLPDYTQRLVLTGRKDVFSGSNRVLIDDRDKNVDDWVKVGGVGIMVPRPWNRLKGTERDVSAHVVNSINRLVLPLSE